jgi:hypothetical protein
MGLGPLAALRRCDVFADLEPEDVAGLIDDLRLEDQPTGTRLLQQGDTGGGLVVIVAGRAAVERVTDQLSQRLAILGPGEVAGEIAPVTGGTRDCLGRDRRADHGRRGWTRGVGRAARPQVRHRGAARGPRPGPAASRPLA